jgi:hypothetical protein
MGKACSTQRDKMNAYKVLAGKPERKKTVARPSHG